MRFLASYIVSGRAQAVGAVAALLGLSLLLPPAGLFSSAALGLVTLRLGGKEGLWVMLAAAVLSAALGGVFIGNPVLFLVYGAVLWVPMWLVARVLRERIDLAAALETAAALAATVVLANYLLVDDPALYWQSVLERLLQPLLDNPPPGLEVEQLHAWLALWAHYMPGVVAAGALSSLALALFLARWWQAQLFNPGGFGKEYLALRVHKPAAYTMLALLVAALAGQGSLSEVAFNLLAIGFALLIMAGAAILHAMSSRVKGYPLLLALLYGAILVVPHALLPIALVGLADVWLDIRRLGRTI